MKTKLKRMASLLVAAVLLAGLLPQTDVLPMVKAQAASRFLDMDNHPSAAIIERWAALGVAWGSNGYFYPDSYVTRAEFFTMMNRMLGATKTASINQYTDVKYSAWYYNDISLAYAGGYIQGTSSTTMSPDDQISREEVVTLISQIMGLYAPNASALSEQWVDADDISNYARGYIAAFTSHGWVSASGETFRPKALITRAEIFEMMDAIFTNVLSSSDSMSSVRLSGNLLIRSPGHTISNMNLQGDLILGDGVGVGNITLRNCTIGGRLVIRGGGPNSISLSNTTVGGGVYIYNANGVTRLENSNDTNRMGIVTARTSTIFEGGGLSSVIIPSDTLENAEFTLRDVTLDSVILEQPGAYIEMESNTVDNFRILPSAAGSTVRLGAAATVNYLDINTSNVTITGRGEVDSAIINASGAVLAMTPRYTYIAPGLTAMIAGREVSGGIGLGAAGYTNTVSREPTAMAVTRNAGNVGGTGLNFATTYLYTSNQVLITQDATGAVPLTELQRLGYWVGFFVPVPERYQDPVVRMSYGFEGDGDSIYSLPVVSQNNIKGVVIYVPVKVDDTGTSGVIDTMVYFVWGDATYENLHLKSNVLKVATATAAQQKTMANCFANAQFTAYNKTTIYTGSEALRRLLLGDNALGLDLRGVADYETADLASLTAKMYSDRATLTTKKAIQNYINEETAFIGALYAVNHATSAPAMRKIFEVADLAAQLGIDTGKSSAYATLSDAGQLSVAALLLTNRKTGYLTEAAVLAAFDKAVSDRSIKEVALLQTINNTTNPTTMQKLLETKTNYELIGIVIDADPYKTAPVSIKTGAAQNVINTRPHESLDSVKAAFEKIVGTPSDPVEYPVIIDPTVLSVSADVLDLIMTVGSTDSVVTTITTGSGSYATTTSLSFVMDKPAIATVDENGRIFAKTLGKAKLTITHTVYTKKKTTVNISVINPIPVTSITLNYTSLDLAVGQTAQVLPALLPSNSTDKLRWSVDDSAIATVSDGFITGVSAGFTTVSAYTDSGIKATCKVFVGGDTPGIILLQQTASVGVRCVTTLEARVSPISASNRTVVWSSMDNTIATVDSTGMVTGVRAGSTTITATSVAFPSLTAECKLTVSNDLRGVFLSDNTLTMYINGVTKLTATIQPQGNSDTDLNWTVTGANDVVKVSNTGAVTALKAGTVTVTATLKNDATAFASCVVTVLSTTLKVSVKPTSISLNVHETSSIAVTFTPVPLNANVDFSVEHPDIASVDQYGLVTALAAGSTNIVCVPQANSTPIKIPVKVTEVKLQSFKIPASIEIVRYNSVPLDVVYIPANASNKQIVWSTSSTDTVSVKDGVITGNLLTRVQATDENGWPKEVAVEKTNPETGATYTSMVPVYENKPVYITATSRATGYQQVCAVTVTERDTAKEVETVAIRLDNWVFQVGGTQTLAVEFNNGDIERDPYNREVTWYSTAPNVVSVDKTGLLTALSPGTATITVTSADGGKVDTKHVVVAPISMSSLSFTNLDTNKTFGNWVRLSLTGTDSTATIGTEVNASATNKDLVWISGDDSVVGVANGVLTAKKIGMTTITVTPVSNLAYGVTKPNSASVDKIASLVTATPTSATNSSLIYMGPNNNTLDVTKDIPLVVHTALPAGTNVFTVVVAPTAASSALFTPPNTTGSIQTVYYNEPFVVHADISPTAAQIDDVKWFADNATVGTATLSGNRSTVSITPTSFSPVTVWCEITTNEQKFTFNFDTAPTERVLTIPAVTITQRIANAFPVAVRKAESLTISGHTATDTVEVYEGDTLTLSPVITPSDATYRTVTWSSSKSALATVDSSGKVTFKVGADNLGGEVKITATLPEDKISTTVTFNVKPQTAPTAITLPDVTLAVGGTVEILAALSHADPDNTAYTKQDLTWRLGSGVATLGSTATEGTSNSLTGVSIGETTLTVTSTRNPTVSASCTVTVTAAAQGFSARTAMSMSTGQVSIEALADAIGAQTDTAIEAASFKSSNPSVATVDSNGVVTAKKVGTAQLTASYGGVTKTVTLDVSGKPPTKVKLRSGARVQLGKTLTLYPDVTPYDANVMIWTSSDPAVATVSQTGVVTALSLGRTTITLSAPDTSITTKCNVTVAKAPTVSVKSVRMNSKVTLQKGNTHEFNAQVLPDNASYQGLSYVSSNPAVATVSVSGVVTALSGGTAIISAIADDGAVKATSTVTVKVTISSLSLNAKKTTLSVGDSKQLTTTILPADASTTVVTWTTSDSKIATVSLDGRVTAVKAGKASITASVGGKRATCTITVK